MHAALACIPTSAVSSEELDRFRQVALIRDEPRFRQLLNELVASKVGVEPARLATPDEREEMLARLRARPEAQPVDPWQASATDLQQGRIALLAEFNRPGNLPLARYVSLAAKSRQHIYKLIKAGKLLALSVGGRGIHIPDWQLAAAPAALTQAVLARAPGVDAWTVYHALSAASERFGGKAPVDAVTLASVDRLAASVLDTLGIHP